MDKITAHVVGGPLDGRLISTDIPYFHVCHEGEFILYELVRFADNRHNLWSWNRRPEVLVKPPTIIQFFIVAGSRHQIYELVERGLLQSDKSLLHDLRAIEHRRIMLISAP